SAQKEFNVATGTSLIVRCDTADAGKIITSLRASIPVLGTKLAEPTNVPEASEDANATEEVVNRIDDPGPGMDWKIDASREEVSAYIGKTFLREALIALGLGMVGILIYVTIRFEFSFAM